LSNKNIHLVAFYSIKPRPGVKTNVKGWMENSANIQYDEKVEITRGIKSNAASAKIILDFSTKTVVRNNFNGDTDFKKLFKYYFGSYSKYMATVMVQLDPTWMDAMVEELEAEIKVIEDAEVKDEVPSN
jgi:hypothetical protein